MMDPQIAADQAAAEIVAKFKQSGVLSEFGLNNPSPMRAIAAGIVLTAITRVVLAPSEGLGR